VISQNDLESELKTIRDDVQRIRPPMGGQPHLFHEDKSDAVRRIGLLLDKVKGIAPREVQKRTSAEIRHARRCWG